ncbi:MAG: hypothetical protein QG622_496 [Actinomycetota bacterium]|nr:hypothetical protein [Actinomycetota bacterium]
MDDLDHWATGRLLSAAARLVEHEWNAHLSRWDLNHAGLTVLHVLFGGPMTQREIAAAAQVEDQTISRTLERLERSGYVERRRHAGDRRRLVVSLTPVGRKACQQASDVAIAEGYFTDGVDDIATFRGALAGIVRHLSDRRWPGHDISCHDASGTPDHKDPT